MDKTLVLLARSARPRQALKSLALLAPLVFTGGLFEAELLKRVIWAAVLFSATASAIYLINDVVDAPADRLHPFKKKRPIASGELSVATALFVAVVMLFIALSLAARLSFFFFWAVVGYAGLHLVYAWWWKKVPIVDVISIAAGFVLRVYAGALVIDAHMNVWFLLTVVSAALFLAVGKRRSELTLLTGLGTATRHRAVLGHYTPALLDVYTGMFANTTWLTYALFSFEQPPIVPTRAKLVSLLSVLPRTFTAQKLLMITVPVVIYGVMRYLQLIYEKNQGESPERVFLSDKPLLISVVTWGVMVVGILYFLV
ncbi:MAG: UbiA prenyltransferase family protein [Candidatus Chisholmbacteria bacterium]|nr:UbiA prenyltransferase family protein [Candidatus Chisholmbacteria bacterium]